MNGLIAPETVLLQGLDRRDARLLSGLAAAIIRTTEALGVRGGPTLLRLLGGLGLGKNAISSVTLPTGKRMCFPTLDSYWGAYLWGRRTYEPDVEAIFRRLAVIPNKLLVDCGANIGFWTVRLSAPEYGFSRFIAVEPNPHLIPILAENVAVNHIDCEVVAAAATEEAGRQTHLAVDKDHA